MRSAPTRPSPAGIRLELSTLTRRQASLHPFPHLLSPVRAGIHAGCGSTKPSSVGGGMLRDAAWVTMRASYRVVSHRFPLDLVTCARSASIRLSLAGAQTMLGRQTRLRVGLLPCPQHTAAHAGLVLAGTSYAGAETLGLKTCRRAVLHRSPSPSTMRVRLESTRMLSAGAAIATEKPTCLEASLLPSLSAPMTSGPVTRAESGSMIPSSAGVAATTSSPCPRGRQAATHRSPSAPEIHAECAPMGPSCAQTGGRTSTGG